MKAGKYLTTLVGLWLLASLPVLTHAEVPRLINYQGKLTDSAGEPVPDGSYEITFSIYYEETGGWPYWTETQTVNVSNGLFNVQLGQVTPLESYHFFGDLDLYLGITVLPDDEMEPRQRLTSTPYAMKAGEADTLQGYSALNFALSSHNHAWSEINNIPADIADGDDGITTETDPTVLASVKDGVSWAEIVDIPADIADGDDGGITEETDPTVLPLVKDGVSWAEVSDKPADFADNIDNTGITIETDPKVGSITTNYVPKWSGSELVTGTIHDYGPHAVVEVEVSKTSTSGIPPFELAFKYGILSEVSGSYTATYALFGDATNSSGSATGVYGRSDGGSGVYGWDIATSGTYAGVYGRSNSTEGRGVHGRTTASSGQTYGVYGESISSDNGSYGGYFTGYGGVRGESTGPAGYAGYFTSADYHGIYVESGPGLTDGVRVASAGYYGVYVGNAGNTGVYVSSGADVGVFANAGSDDATDYGGYFRGYNGVAGYAESNSGYAGDFRGNVRIRDRVSGTTVMELGTGLDYAEGFDVSGADRIEPGSVLIIDPDNPGRLTLSTEPYDTKVVGIAAGANGIGSGVRLGGDQFDQDVALAGRVYCKVDATEAGVGPGDMLTTSNTPGYAMKAIDHYRAQGAILGKAMQRLEKGKKAEILVLVTLQ